MKGERHRITKRTLKNKAEGLPLVNPRFIIKLTSSEQQGIGERIDTQINEKQ